MQPFPMPRASLLKISPYIGGDVTPKGFIRRVGLSSNENPFGPSPKAQESIKHYANKVHLYPSSTTTELRQEIAKAHNIDPDWILCGNGSEDLLHLLARSYAASGDEVVFSEYAFGLYQIATLAVGAAPVAVPRTGFVLTAQNILDKITQRTKMIYLDHPGNPIGNFLGAEYLVRLIESAPPSVLIVLDAAYAEYLAGEVGYTSGIDLVPRFPNVVMVRTFSKVYGLAGLRLGWIYANPKILDAVNRIRPPFNANLLAQKAGIAALQDQAWVKEACDHNAIWRSWFEDQMQKLGLSIVPCQSNFSLVNFAGKTKDVYQSLCKRGIIVRPMEGYGLPEYLRITIGQANDMKELVDCLKEFYNEKGS